ncbi:MAG: hypothetical protein B6245_17950 [Desulfobacteraceae bacterium 4572_88]|nr:MAG: hypothetical protein B6245_17950 [Desulfobacteraceae bacterium 4572_88]
MLIAGDAVKSFSPASVCKQYFISVIMPQEKPYTKRQLDILSQVGLFYLLIIAFFAVPLLGAFVIVLIKGVVDFRYAILLGGVLLLGIALFGLVQFLRKLFWKIRQDGASTHQEMREKMRQGEQVQLSILNGLISFSYGGGGRGVKALPGGHEDGSGPSALLPYVGEQKEPTRDLIVQLKELSELKKQGVIDEDEFQKIKARLIETPDS